SPLSAIVMTSQMMLKRGGLTPEASKSFGIVARCADRMARMIAQLMDYTGSRFGGGLLVRRERVDLATLCREAAADAESGNPGRRVSCEARGECVGMWCPMGLSRILSNLISNALQH